MNKEKLILDDFYRANCVEQVLDGDEFLGGKYVEKEIKPDMTIYELYKKCPGQYKIIFAVSHNKFNDLLNFMNIKINANRHYNARESRELLELIRNISSLRNELAKIGIQIEIDEKYNNRMIECRKFLKESNGSEIPKSITYFETVKYDPIFKIKNLVDKTRLEKFKINFSNDYQTTKAKELLNLVETDQVRAIGDAKEYIEACLQTILEGKIDKDIDKMDVSELMTEVRKLFKLNNSSIKEVVKIIAGLSSVINGVCELRNHKGSGHSHVKYPPPSQREAQLAVDAAITIVNFYWSLYEEKMQGIQPPTYTPTQSPDKNPLPSANPKP